MSDVLDDLFFDWRTITSAAIERQQGKGGRSDRPWAASAPRQTKMLAFPAHRRIGEIRRLAEQIQRRPQAAAEAHVRQQLSRKAEALRRRPAEVAA